MEAKSKEREVGGLRLEAKSTRYVFPFEKLEVWSLVVDLADFVLGLLERITPNKHLRLIGQTEAAVVSLSQNIAEGKGRQYKKEFIQFLHIGQGSLYELLTLVEVFRRRRLFTESDSIEIRDRCEVIDRKINGLVNSLHGREGKEVASNLERSAPPTAYVRLHAKGKRR